VHLTLKALLNGRAGCRSLLGFFLDAGEAFVSVQHLVWPAHHVITRESTVRMQVKQVRTGSDSNIVQLGICAPRHRDALRSTHA